MESTSEALSALVKIVQRQQQQIDVSSTGPRFVDGLFNQMFCGNGKTQDLQQKLEGQANIWLNEEVSCGRFTQRPFTMCIV